MRKIEELKSMHTSNECVKTTCDICGASTDRNNWGEDSYDEQIITIENSVGGRYPEGGIGETFSYDLCPDCFTDKLEPFLQALGARPETTDWDDSMKYVQYVPVES